MLLLGTCRIVYMPPFPLSRRLLALIFFTMLVRCLLTNLYLYKILSRHVDVFCSPFGLLKISTISSERKTIQMRILKIPCHPLYRAYMTHTQKSREKRNIPQSCHKDQKNEKGLMKMHGIPGLVIYFCYYNELVRASARCLMHYLFIMFLCSRIYLPPKVMLHE